MRVHLAAETGRPIAVGAITVTPHSQSVTVNSRVGSLVWSRPTQIIIERGGRTERIQVADVTRILQLGILALATLLTIAVWIVGARRERKQS
jgi:hypothetical protein